MAQRWALPSDVNRETATNDAIAYSCKKIGHFYSAYFLHNPIYDNLILYTISNEQHLIFEKHLRKCQHKSKSYKDEPQG